MTAALLALALVLQDPPPVDMKKVDYAVERGGRYLLLQVSKGVPDVKHPTHPQMGLEELAAYALLHTGLDLARERRFQEALDRIVAKELKWTYQTSLAALTLEALDKTKYQWRLAQCAQFLVDNECVNGQWSYGAPIKFPEGIPKGPPAEGTPGGSATVAAIKIVRRGKGPPKGDNSNAQYAALGLRACSTSGLQIPDEAFSLAAKWWEKCQNKDGGWGYSDDGQIGDPSHGSMTAGGASSLIICRHLLNQDFEKYAPVKRALDWVGANFTVLENPNYARPYQWHHYWLYAVERAGILYGTEKIGDHAWYPEGVEFLLKAQQKDGSWVSEKGGYVSPGGEVADTAFAILFLRRATKPLPKVITGK
jgi:hypothetical protein